MSQEINGKANGVFAELKIIKEDVKEIKDDLSSSIDHLTTAVNALTQKFEQFIVAAHNSMPIKTVYWLMGIMILGLIGIEGVKNIAPAIRFMFTGH